MKVERSNCWLMQDLSYPLAHFVIKFPCAQNIEPKGKKIYISNCVCQLVKQYHHSVHISQMKAIAQLVARTGTQNESLWVGKCQSVFQNDLWPRWMGLGEQPHTAVFQSSPWLCFCLFLLTLFESEWATSAVGLPLKTLGVTFLILLNPFLGAPWRLVLQELSPAYSLLLLWCHTQFSCATDLHQNTSTRWHQLLRLQSKGLVEIITSAITQISSCWEKGQFGFPTSRQGRGVGRKRADLQCRHLRLSGGSRVQSCFHIPQQIPA